MHSPTADLSSFAEYCDLRLKKNEKLGLICRCQGNTWLLDALFVGFSVVVPFPIAFIRINDSRAEAPVEAPAAVPAAAPGGGSPVE